MNKINNKKKSDKEMNLNTSKDDGHRVMDSGLQPECGQFNSILHQNHGFKLDSNKTLHLTSSSNLLFEDENVYGITINDSIMNIDGNIAAMTIESNILHNENFIKINVPDSLSMVNNSIIDRTSINALTVKSTEQIIMTPVDNIVDIKSDVLRLNCPVDSCLTGLGIQKPSDRIIFSQSDDFLKITTMDNLNRDECGSMRLTTDENLFIKDGMDVFNTELSIKINVESPIFKIHKDNRMYLSGGDINYPLLSNTHVNFLVDDTKSLLSSFELSKIGTSIDVSIEESSAIQNRFLGLTDSYSNLFKPYMGKDLFINTLPDTIALQTPYEFYRDTELISLISNDSDTIEIEDEDVESEINDELTDYLSEINSDMPEMLKGAKVALKSKNPDRIRHFSSSLRELFTHVLHHLSPNKEIKKWSKDPNHYYNNNPTRKARLLYICRGINHDSFTEFVNSDVDSVLSFLNLFLSGTHSIKSKLTDVQLGTMLLRMESTLTYLIKTGKIE